MSAYNMIEVFFLSMYQLSMNFVLIFSFLFYDLWVKLINNRLKDVKIQGAVCKSCCNNGFFTPPPLNLICKDTSQNRSTS